MDAGAHSGYAHRGGSDPPDDPSAAAALDDADLMFARRGCCCFWVPCFGSGGPAARGAAWERIGGGAPAGAPVASPADGPWWRRALMKVREWSEIVAGPRWKTFIRRFNRNHHRRWGSGGVGVGGGAFCGGGGGGGGGGAARVGKFQYDPLSYALNFDEGPGAQGGAVDDDYVYRDFSARYVMPPSSAKSSMDLGGRDAPPLFPAT